MEVLRSGRFGGNEGVEEWECSEIFLNSFFGKIWKFGLRLVFLEDLVLLEIDFT